MFYSISPGLGHSLRDVYYFHMLRLGSPDLSASQPAALLGLAMQRATPVGHRWNCRDSCELGDLFLILLLLFFKLG